MFSSLKAAARKSLPRPLRHLLGKLYGRVKISRARRAFLACRESSQCLPPAYLSQLMQDGYRQPEVIRYDPEGLELRAQEKVSQLQKRLLLSSCRDCLELGCWDGIVGAELARLGKRAYGLDLTEEGFDPRARAAGVQFVKGDVAGMPLADQTMDLIYSFAAFEHFADPDAVLRESHRVLRKGGHLYLLFGPVYTSPYGRHAYRQIPIPYCHYLFKEEDLRAYTAQKGLEARWPYVNGVTVTEYRRLWKKHAGGFERLYYKEHPTGGAGAELVARYPSCFKGKVPQAEDLFVSAIELCWRKR